MVPDVAALHYRAYTDGDEAHPDELLREFYFPLVRLRDKTPGFGVALIKAGLRLRGLDVGCGASAARRPRRRAAGGAPRRDPRRRARARRSDARRCAAGGTVTPTIRRIADARHRVPLPRPWVPEAPDLHLIEVASRTTRAPSARVLVDPDDRRLGGAALLDHDIRRFAVGQDADPATLWPPLWAHLHEAGGGGITTIAMAGLDLALWDLRARRAGVGLATASAAGTRRPRSTAPA